MPIKKSLITFGILLVSIIVSPAQANGFTGWYVGGSIGKIDTEAEFDFQYDGYHYQFEDKGSSADIGLYAGYNFTKYFGLEFGTFLTGDISDKDFGANDADLITIYVMPKFTLQASDHIGFFFRAGLALMLYSEYYSSDYDDDINWDGFGYMLGTGVQISLPSNGYLRIGYDMGKGSLDDDDGDDLFYGVPDVDLSFERFYLGAHYQF